MTPLHRQVRAEVVSGFLAVVSHELRTPLTPVLMTVSSLESDVSLPEWVRSELAMIRRNIELESQLIDDLLELSRINSGRLTIHLERVDVNQSARDASCSPTVG